MEVRKFLSLVLCLLIFRAQLFRVELSVTLFLKGFPNTASKIQHFFSI